MKRIFKSFLAAAGLSMGLLTISTSAFALTSTVQPARNGIVCNKITGGTYPADGHFYYCGDNPVDLTVASALQSALADPSMTTNVRSSLSGQNVNFYVFKNIVDRAKYFIPAPTQAQLDAQYDGAIGTAGRSNTGSTTSGWIDDGHTASALQTIATGGGLYSAPLSLNDMKFDIMHEAGHHYDPSSVSSFSVAYGQLVVSDQDYMDQQAFSPTANALRKTYSYFLINQPNKAWQELYANEFAYKLSSITAVTPDQATINAIDPYFSCSRAYVHAHMITGSDPVKADFDALDNTAYARCTGNAVLPPICFEQGVTLNNYPLDGNNVAGATHAYRCNNNSTNVKPSDARTSALFVSALQTMPANVKSKLKAQNVKIYYFNNRKEANLLWMDRETGSSNRIAYSIGAVCADASSDSSGNNVIVSVYDYCSYRTGVASLTLNPDLKRTTHHEMGEAFGMALEPASPKFSKVGFVTLLGSDIATLTPSTWATTMTQPQRYSYLCGLYGTSAPSTLEKLFGANLNGKTTAPIGAVCTGSTPELFYQPVTKTPNVVAGDKMPMFSNSRELWAEAFVIVLDSSTAPVTWLPTVDRAIGAAPGGFPRSFNCTRGVVEYYINNLATIPATAPVGQISLQSLGCNQTPGPL